MIKNAALIVLALLIFGLSYVNGELKDQNDTLVGMLKKPEVTLLLNETTGDVALIMWSADPMIYPQVCPPQKRL